MKTVRANCVWVSWILTISKSDGFGYANGRDVTLEKLAVTRSRNQTKQIEIAEQYALEASHAKSFL
jgi:hypothetical protein